MLRSLGWYFSEQYGWQHADLAEEDQWRVIDEDEAYEAAKNQIAPERTEFLGKAIRWYYGANTQGEIIAATSGNKVPKSDGAQPLMRLPDYFPLDVDYAWYEAETEKLLKWVGYA